MNTPILLHLTLLIFVTLAMSELQSCRKKIRRVQAEQADEAGLRCWDTVSVPYCGGRCDSREIADWEFPYKKSHHPVCVHGIRKPLMARLRNCDSGVTPGTDIFHFIAAEDCHCKKCSSQHTSCEWLPPNSTLLEGISNDDDDDDEEEDGFH